jgi:hypothetical protein
MTENNKIFCVTLAFNPPGPLHSSLLIAPDETTAAAMAMQSAMAIVPEHASLVGTVVFAVDPDALRQMLRAVEGKGPGEVVSLVRPEQRVAEILRKHEPDLDTADAWTFTGAAVERRWDDIRYRRDRDKVCVYGEPFGPPMPGGAA